MSLLGLPIELLQEVLRYAIEDRRAVKQCMRLRLVCKAFAEEVIECIRTFKMLDDCLRSYTSKFVKFRPAFLPIYIEHRVWIEPRNGIPHLVLIRDLAEHLSKTAAPEDQSEDGVRKIVRKLSGFVAQNGDLRRIFKKNEPAPDLSDFRYETHLLAAAVIMEDLATFKRLISKGHNLRRVSNLFGRIPALPMFYDDHEMIDLYISDKSLMIQRDYRYLFLVAAAAVGNLTAVKYLLYYHTDEIPWEWHDNTKLEWTRDIWARMLNTNHREIWDYTVEMMAHHPSRTPYGPDLATRNLQSCARLGKTEMAKYLISLGADVDGFENERKECRPIVAACLRGFPETVRLLLNSGAKTTGTIAVAASGGYMNIVRMLLDHGVDPDESYPKKGGYPEYGDDELLRGYPPALVSAVKLEHTALFEFLLERGATLTPEIGKFCRVYARENGLSSMWKLLREHGIGIGAHPTDCGRLLVRRHGIRLCDYLNEPFCKRLFAYHTMVPKVF